MTGPHNAAGWVMFGVMLGPIVLLVAAIALGIVGGVFAALWYGLMEAWQSVRRMRTTGSPWRPPQ